MGKTSVLVPLAVNAREAAHLSGVSVATWWRMDAAGKTPPSLNPSPKRRVWRTEDLRLWIDAGMPDRESFLRMRGEK